MTKTNKSYRYLLAVIGINFATHIFVNIFLISHLLNIADKGIYTVAIFYIVAYVVMTPLYLLSSVLLKKINKIHIFRFGMLLKVVFISALIILNDYLLNNIVLVAVLYGLEESIFWSAYNSMRTEIVSKKHIKTYTALQSITEFSVQIVVPILLGFLIDLSSFSYMLFAIFAVTVIQFVLTMFIKNNQLSIQQFSLKNFYSKIKELNQSSVYRRVFTNHFLKGITEIVPIIVVYITVLTYKTNTSLGAITSMISVFSIVIMSLFSKFYNSKNHNKIILPLAIISAIGLLPLFFAINKTTLIIFNLVFSLFILVPNIVTFVNRNLVAQKLNLTEFYVENNAMTEVYLNIGRVVGFAMLLLVGIQNSIPALKVLLVASMVLIVALGLSVYMVEKKSLTIE